MLEIEKRYKLKNGQVESVRKIAEVVGKYEGSVRQSDEVFLPSGTTFENRPANAPVIRIREEDDRLTVTYKRLADRTTHAAAEEIEFGALGRMEVKAFLAVIGFSPVLRVAKTRRTFRLDAHTTICLDSVDRLGEFLEVELLRPTGTRMDETDLARIRDVVAALGLREVAPVTERYDTMIARLGH